MKNCWLPYYHAEIDSSGKVKPCCKYNSFWIDNLKDYNLVNRSEFEKKELSIFCQSCNIKNSYRNIKMDAMKRHGLPEPGSPKLLSLNITLDNVCSNSCLMCNKDNSTTIGYLLKDQVKREWSLDYLDEHLPNLQWISILGGEPLQSPRLPVLCEKLKKHNVKEINIITSLANIKKSNVDALMSVGVPINFRISIDGPQDLNEWIRGYKQDSWIKNFNIVKNCGTINWQITLGNYNVFALPECLDYIETLMPRKNVLPCIVENPKQCAVAEIPQYIKDKIKIKLEKYNAMPNNYQIINTAIELLNSTNSLKWEECKIEIEKLPFLRGETLDLNYFIKKYLDV